MADNHDKINQLLSKLELLLAKQETFANEINYLKNELNELKHSEINPIIETEEQILTDVLDESDFIVEQETIAPPIEIQQKLTQQENSNPSTPNSKQTKTSTFDLEKFIGENLINKIGIVITIIGVSIGAKYSIEHDLISPLTRIILGYLAGVVLLGFGIKLKVKYHDYSAVLVSGAIAILYFITYAAYSMYNLFPQTLAFGLMVVFTAFTVVAAINYNRQVIAHIGLVGAYAVPFLLSDGSGKVVVLFSYMVIINIGILVISFKKYWKSLYYSSFGLTWLVFFSWLVVKYQVNEHFKLGLIFLLIFFTIFYLTFLAYKILRKEKFEVGDVLLLLSNSFIFYGQGYIILSGHKTGEQLLGLFTLCNAIIHFVFSTLIYKQKLADKNIFYLVSGLVLVFITIAVPVQLEGNWVTLLWVGESVLLFWIGRTKNISIYEKISYPLMVLALLNITNNWATLYDTYDSENLATRIPLLLNINFLTSILFVTAFGYINYLNQNKKYISAIDEKNMFSKMISFLLPTVFIVSLYFAFRMEIITYWNQQFSDAVVTINNGDENPTKYWNYDLLKYRTIWIINYTLLFVSILSFVNIKKIKNQLLGLINLGVNVLAILTFLVQGLYSLSLLRDTYLNPTLAEHFNHGGFNIGIRYISLTLIALTLLMSYKYIKQDFIKSSLKLGFDLLLYITVLWILSSELINIMDLQSFNQSYKLGLSVLWGVYSLVLISLGIWKNKQHLRIGAIILFGITLIKLFFYDISHLDTIAKTIVFVSLGILLLIISFLYNKYKHLITDESTK